MTAGIIIQKRIRGFLARRRVEKAKELAGLPDLKSKDVADAAVKIQSVYKGFQIRKKKKVQRKRSMFEVITAAIIIQKAIRKFLKVRREKKRKELEDLPDLKCK